MTKKSLTLAVATVALASLSAKAQVTAYDNTTGYQNLVTSLENSEVGDEINLTTGAGSILTDFQFEYNYSGGDGATGVLRLWDKAGTLPGTLLLQSTPFTLTSGSHSAGISGQSLLLNSSTLIWTVDFEGIGAGETAGLLFYNGVGVGGGPGQSFDDYWENTGTVAVPTWVLRKTDDVAFPSVIDNFGARVTVVPEPTTVGLLIGGAAMLGLAARRRKA